MLTMNLTWLIWLALIGIGLFWISIFLGIIEASARLGDLLLNPSKKPPSKEPPEEAAMRNIKALAQLRKWRSKLTTTERRADLDALHQSSPGGLH